MPQFDSTTSCLLGVFPLSRSRGATISSAASLVLHIHIFWSFLLYLQNTRYSRTSISLCSFSSFSSLNLTVPLLAWSAPEGLKPLIQIWGTMLRQRFTSDVALHFAIPHSPHFTPPHHCEWTSACLMQSGPHRTLKFKLLSQSIESRDFMRTSIGN